MSSPLKSVTFAFILCLVCAILLTAASTGLKERQGRNINLDRQKNILKSVGLIDENRRYLPVEIEKRFAENIRLLHVNEKGEIASKKITDQRVLPIYVYEKSGAIESYIVPIDTRGLWGRILGYLAIQKDGSTISGFTVYKHAETPGLGGEIETRWFQKNFVGKKIINQNNEFVSVSIVKGAVKGQIPKKIRANYVDGISGATLTGRYLSAGIKDILQDYEPVSIRFRKGSVKALNSSADPKKN
jgi:Na+-transporting NADH:ubiquinone oxidoreductase subunit C